MTRSRLTAVVSAARLDRRRGRGSSELPGRDPASRRVAAGGHRSGPRAHPVRGLDSPGRGAANRRPDRESFLSSSRHGRSATGLEYDKKSERLFVSGGGTGAAYVYDANNGAPIADYLLLTPAAPRFINDNVLTEDAVYFTDSMRPWFYRLPLGNHGELPTVSDVETVPLGGDYVHQPGFNLNGIVASASEKWLIAVQSSTASLSGSTRTPESPTGSSSWARRRDER